MKFLFLHQNFPGQFRHVVPVLQNAGHEVRGLGVGGLGLPGVMMYRYKTAAAPAPSPAASVPGPAASLELMTRRLQNEISQGTHAAQAMLEVRKQGFTPDVVVAHPGWGEALFVKDVWPAAKLVVFSEFYMRAEGADYSFDPEFKDDRLLSRTRLRLRNVILAQSLIDADAAYSPTRWQHSVLPPEFHNKVQVIFDGIDTAVVKPDPEVQIMLPPATSGGAPVQVSRRDEILTFVNRNLEPYRGFHRFMRALPEVLRDRPQARCVIVGGDEVSYGGAPPAASGHKDWRSFMMAEVGAQLPLDRVHFVGKLPYAIYLKVLQVSRCHVYLTYPFVLGWSCVEAMSAGAVIVGSDTAPVREVITHGQSGLLVDFFDTAALAGQVKAVLADPGAYAALGQAARATVQARYELADCIAQQKLLLLG